MATVNVIGDDLISRAYFPEEGHLELPIGVNFGQSLRIDAPDASLFPIPVTVREQIRRISQLGLKEAWLGRRPSMHNRWQHSVGAFNVAHIWLRVLQEDGRVPLSELRPPLSTWPRVHTCLGTAMLLHDFGHLPFSHLLEEVMESIHWLPPLAGRHSLEAAVIEYRLHRQESQEVWRALLNGGLGDASDPGFRDSDSIEAVIKALILGQHGCRWIQAIANSPIDADKLDYLRFDAEFLRSTPYPVTSRLHQDDPTQFLSEFLHDQTVNHAGLLCLNGRSAVAAADMWRERIFLYDRFYLSPDLRVPDRMAFEIVQQFLIRTVMGPPRWRVKSLEGLNGFAELMAADDPTPKYTAVLAEMDQLLETIRDESRELSLLSLMLEAIDSTHGIDSAYLAFLKECLGLLRDLSTGHLKLRELVATSLVREAMVIHADDYERAFRALRVLGHVFCREALIDIVKFPRVLAASTRFQTGFERGRAKGIDYAILVPDGPASTWGPGKRATQPLTDDSVEELERRYARVTVIAPKRAESAKALYVWDRARAALLEAGIEILSESGGVE